MKAFTACPECGNIVAVRRNGKVRLHKLKKWDDKTQTGRMARCPGTNQKVKCQAAWATYQEAEKAIGNQRQQSMKELLRDIQPAQPTEDHAEENRAAAAEPTLLLPGRDF